MLICFKYRLSNISFLRPFLEMEDIIKYGESKVHTIKRRVLESQNLGWLETYKTVRSTNTKKCIPILLLNIFPH